MPVWTPWPCSWSSCPQLRSWLLSRETMRSCRRRGSSGSWQRKQEAKARGEAVKRPVKRPHGSKDKPSPLTAPSGPSSGAWELSNSQNGYRHDPLKSPFRSQNSPLQTENGKHQSIKLGSWLDPGPTVLRVHEVIKNGFAGWLSEVHPSEWGAPNRWSMQECSAWEFWKWFLEGIQLIFWMCLLYNNIWPTAQAVENHLDVG